jgi:hypothetical protein
MKAFSIALTTVATLASLTSCYVWQPPTPGGRSSYDNSTSLNNPPPQTRYLDRQEGQAYQQPPTQPQATRQIPVQSDDDPKPLSRDESANNSENPPVPPPPSENATEPSSNKPTPPPTASTGSSLYGIKVPNKPGFVLSPYDKSARIVDVQGIAPGTKVKCPYTGKIFLVP